MTLQSKSFYQGVSIPRKISALFLCDRRALYLGSNVYSIDALRGDYEHNGKMRRRYVFILLGSESQMRSYIQDPCCLLYDLYSIVL